MLKQFLLVTPSLVWSLKIDVLYWSWMSSGWCMFSTIATILASTPPAKSCSPKIIVTLYHDQVISSISVMSHMLHGAGIWIPTFARTKSRTKSPSFVGKYTSTMGCISVMYFWTVDKMTSYILWWTNSLQWKDPPFFMGKSTISMAIFHGKMLVHQRVAPIAPKLRTPQG